MSNFQNVTQAIPVIARKQPPEGQKIIPFECVFSAGDFSASFSQNLQSMMVTQIRTIFVDNSANSSEVTLVHGVANQTVVIPAGGGAIIPTTSNNGGFTFTLAQASAPGNDVTIGVDLYNYEISPAIWGEQTTIIQQTVPIGTISLWYGSEGEIPEGYGLCDGSTYTRSDGAGTITSPDLVGVFPIGAKTASGYVPGNSYGSDTISQANLPSYNLTVTDPGHDHAITDPGHNHAITDPGHSHTSEIGGSTGTAQYPTKTGFNNVGLPTSHNTTGITINSHTTGITIDSDTTGITVASGGSGTPYLPACLALCYIIKF